MSTATVDSPEVLKLGLILFDGVFSLDFNGPLGLFSFLALDPFRKSVDSKIAFTFDYLAPSRDPVSPMGSPQVLPTKSFKEALAEGIQYDIILIPGGSSIYVHQLLDSRTDW